MASGGRLISDFFIALNESPELRELYKEEPRAAYEEFGLDERQREILETANLREIQQAIRDEYAGAVESATVVLFVMHVAWPTMHIALPDIEDPGDSPT